MSDIPRPSEIRRWIAAKVAERALVNDSIASLKRLLKLSIEHYDADVWDVELPVATTLPVPEPLPATPRPEPVAAEAIGTAGSRPAHPKKDHTDPRR